MEKILFVGIGGFIGASLRYIVTIHSTKIFGDQFPYGTLIVNVIGGLLIGFIMELSLNSSISPSMKLFLATGILGGLTTFSTFSYETITLFTAGRYLSGIVNTGLNLFLSLGGVILGKLIAAKIV